MIALYGSKGFIGSAFAKELTERGLEWYAADYRADPVFPYDTDLVINCAAFIPKQSVSLCDRSPKETIAGNVILPAKLAWACAGITLAHISTGCLWSDGKEHKEDDPPQRAFTGHCGFYIGTKLMSEEEVSKNPDHYIFRVRLPFDNMDCDRNYLSKLTRFEEVWDQTNSISHRGDFAKACLDMIHLNAPFGTYNVCNVGSISAAVIVERMREMKLTENKPRIIYGKTEGQCRLNTDKMLSTGIKIRTVDEAVNDSLHSWLKEAHV